MNDLLLTIILKTDNICVAFKHVPIYVYQGEVTLYKLSVTLIEFIDIFIDFIGNLLVVHIGLTANER